MAILESFGALAIFRKYDVKKAASYNYDSFSTKHFIGVLHDSVQKSCTYFL